MKGLISATLLAVAYGAQLPFSPTQLPSQMKSLFRHVDSNGDGRVSKGEMMASAKDKHFSAEATRLCMPHIESCQYITDVVRKKGSISMKELARDYSVMAKGGGSFPREALEAPPKNEFGPPAGIPNPNDPMALFKEKIPLPSDAPKGGFRDNGPPGAKSADMMDNDNFIELWSSLVLGSPQTKVKATVTTASAATAAATKASAVPKDAVAALTAPVHDNAQVAGRVDDVKISQASAPKAKVTLAHNVNKNVIPEHFDAKVRAMADPADSLKGAAAMTKAAVVAERVEEANAVNEKATNEQTVLKALKQQVTAHKAAADPLLAARVKQNDEVAAQKRELENQKKLAVQKEITEFKAKAEKEKLAQEALAYHTQLLHSKAVRAKALSLFKAQEAKTAHLAVAKASIAAAASQHQKAQEAKLEAKQEHKRELQLASFAKKQAIKEHVFELQQAKVAANLKQARAHEAEVAKNRAAGAKEELAREAADAAERKAARKEAFSQAANVQKSLAASLKKRLASFDAKHVK